MAERTNIPNSPECGHWETLLADALDGLLRPEDESGLFHGTHSASARPAPLCLKSPSVAANGSSSFHRNPRFPLGLLDKILAQTGPGQVAGYGLVDADSPLPVTPVWRPQHPGFMGRVVAQTRRFAEPRLLMTAAMAFFSIALTLNLTNVRLSGLRLSDLRPSSIRSFMERRVNMASTPIIRYYDHLRFVYEVQTRVRELRRTTETDNSPKPSQSNPEGESRNKIPSTKMVAPAHRPSAAIWPARNPT